MCMKATEEGCVLREQLDDVKKAQAAFDTRLTKVEDDVRDMRSESQYGFRAINTALAELGHDFGARMNNFDKRIEEEKEKWGNTLRTILMWGAKALILGALTAMGVNILRGIFKW